MVRHIVSAGLLGVMVIAQVWGAELAVTEFGAVPGDTANDAAAINAAIAMAQPGDVVTIPEGMFVLADSVVLRTGIT